MFLAPDPAMLRDVSGSLRDDLPYLFQWYVANSRGRILRVEVIDGAAVRAYEATEGIADACAARLAPTAASELVHEQLGQQSVG